MSYSHSTKNQNTLQGSYISLGETGDLIILSLSLIEDDRGDKEVEDNIAANSP